MISLLAESLQRASIDTTRRRTAPGLLLAAVAVMCASPGAADSWGGDEKTALKSKQQLGDYLKSVLSRGSVPAEAAPCHACETDAVYVPHEVSWVNNTDPTFVNELFMVNDPALVWNYWGRVRAATHAANAKPLAGGTHKKALHEACNLMHIPEAVARIAKSKTLGSSGRTPGVLLYLRGDSHSRVMYQAVVRALTRDKTAALSANFGHGVGNDTFLYTCLFHPHPFAHYLCLSLYSPFFSFFRPFILLR